MENTFIKVASFQYSSEAMIIKGRLEAEGIEVFMKDNNTIDTDPLVSNAIGGVKLLVRFEDKDRATEVLQDVSRYSLNDQGKPLTCPECNSHEIELGTTIKDIKSLFAFLFTFIAVVLPFYTKYKYRCNNCGNEFNIE